MKEAEYQEFTWDKNWTF